eukprot:699182-Pelagomonas_calceolata.AAC.5
MRKRSSHVYMDACEDNASGNTAGKHFMLQKKRSALRAIPSIMEQACVSALESGEIAEHASKRSPGGTPL